MSFVRNVWYVAAWADEIQDGLLGRTLLNEPVLLYRLQSGTAVAVGNRCPHRFAPLSMGRRCADDSIECAYHGLRFDASGACVGNPHEDGKIPRNAKIPTYPLVERYGVLWIWMGVAEQADPATIPVFDQISDPRRRTVKGATVVQAHYELIADNLLDLSHTQFLHANFAQADDLLSVRHEVVQEGNTVHSRRWVPGIKAPGSFARSLPDPDAKVDHWMRVRWDAPALHRLDVGVTLEGSDEAAGIRREGSHLLTPETESSTHYFYANSRNYRVDDAAEDERIAEWQRIGFGVQDKPMIEAVQRMMGGQELMALRPVLLGVDTAAVRARRVLQSLLDAEQERPRENAA